ncbi:MAG TPA: hypothetical protein VGO68_16595 [Pyrinomonadaceae bacterium]|jgi:hypothetical protein|nr:hypothetical protein [Pyrinomonadaceae bacterium]
MAVTAFVLVTFVVATAQNSDRCQIVSIESPAKEVDQGTSIVFSAKLNTVVPTAQSEFKWEITAGTIMAGQGTSSITVDTSGLGGQTVAATVSVSGVSTSCSTSATQSVAVLSPPPCGMPLDEYGDIRFEDEKARLDNFAIQLFNYPDAKGYIFVYAGRQTYESEAAERVLRAKNYLVKVRHIDPARILAIDGGYQEDFVVILIVAPPDAIPPVSMPTLSPTEIKLTKPRPKSARKTSHKSRNK